MGKYKEMDIAIEGLTQKLETRIKELYDYAESEGIIITYCGEIRPDWFNIGFKGCEQRFSFNIYIAKEYIVTKIKDCFPFAVIEKCEAPKYSNLDLLKELLDNPRVEKISINYEKIGEVGIAKIEAELKGDELKCHYKREIHKKL